MPTGSKNLSGAALDFALAKAHVAEWEVRVEHQEKLAAKAGDAAAGEARRVLAEFREQLERARQHLRRLQEGDGDA